MLNVLTRRELSERLGVRTETLSRWAHSGKGPKCGRIGARVLYLEDDVNKWITAQMNAGATA